MGTLDKRKITLNKQILKKIPIAHCGVRRNVDLPLNPHISSKFYERVNHGNNTSDRPIHTQNSSFVSNSSPDSEYKPVHPGTQNHHSLNLNTRLSRGCRFAPNQRNTQCDSHSHHCSPHPPEGTSPIIHNITLIQPRISNMTIINDKTSPDVFSSTQTSKFYMEQSQKLRRSGITTPNSHLNTLYKPSKKRYEATSLHHKPKNGVNTSLELPRQTPLSKRIKRFHHHIA